MLGSLSPRQDSEGNWWDLYYQWAVCQPSDDDNDDNDSDDHDDNHIEDNVMILIAIDLLQWHCQEDGFVHQHGENKDHEYRQHGWIRHRWY